jgi:hypothetical protein
MRPDAIRRAGDAPWRDHIETVATALTEEDDAIRRV